MNTAQPSTSVTISPLEQVFAAAMPSLVWVLLILAVLVWFHQPLVALLRALVLRVEDGAAFKVAGFEIGASAGVVAIPGQFDTSGHSGEVAVDTGERQALRDGIYDELAGAMLVHRLQRSRRRGQLYDILIYLIPHKTNFAGIDRVEYFFGRMWSKAIFTSRERARGFPLVTSAYGPFLCCARIHFNDGSFAEEYRYIDFEMGLYAPHARESRS